MARLLFTKHEPPHNQAGGHLRQIVARVSHSPVYGMAIRNGRWWAHTAWGYWPVQHYLEHANRWKVPA